MLGLIALIAVIALVHPAPPALAIGSQAPPLTLRDADGVQHTVTGGASKPVLVEFLSTACDSCAQRASTLCRTAAGDQGAIVAAVDAANDSASAVAQFRARWFAPPCSVPLLLDPGQASSKVWQISVVPTVYVIDAHGRVAFVGYGTSGIDQAVNALQQAMHG